MGISVIDFAMNNKVVNVVLDLDLFENMIAKAVSEVWKHNMKTSWWIFLSQQTLWTLKTDDSCTTNKTTQHKLAINGNIKKRNDFQH